jgi:CRISPR/Cas system CSM-associated protein Csm2 small subunit
VRISLTRLALIYAYTRGRQEVGEVNEMHNEALYACLTEVFRRLEI